MEVLRGHLIQGQPLVHVQGECAIGIDVPTQQRRQRLDIRFPSRPCHVGSANTCWSIKVSICFVTKST